MQNRASATTTPFLGLGQASAATILTPPSTRTLDHDKGLGHDDSLAGFRQARARLP
jgi:hypothetical protein